MSLRSAALPVSGHHGKQLVTGHVADPLQPRWGKARARGVYSLAFHEGVHVQEGKHGHEPHSVKAPAGLLCVGYDDGWLRLFNVGDLRLHATASLGTPVVEVNVAQDRITFVLPLKPLQQAPASQGAKDGLLWTVTSGKFVKLFSLTLQPLASFGQLVKCNFFFRTQPPWPSLLYLLLLFPVFLHLLLLQSRWPQPLQRLQFKPPHLQPPKEPAPLASSAFPTATATAPAFNASNHSTSSRPSMAAAALHVSPLPPSTTAQQHRDSTGAATGTDERPTVSHGSVASPGV